MKITQDKIDRIVKLQKEGLSKSLIAKRMGVNVTTIRTALKMVEEGNAYKNKPTHEMPTTRP
jgi:DNA invertase Pin-like site-specific DNA recombinase